MPIALMVAELTTLLPEEGGYYVWVREALGSFWALQEAWWTVSYSIMVLAVYPILFVNYLSYLVPWIGATVGAASGPGVPLVRWLIAVTVIASAMFVNLRGTREVGRLAVFSTSIVLGAFFILVIISFSHGAGVTKAASVVVADLASGHREALLLGLSTSVLAYGGWDNISTFAGEVDRPSRNYPIALGVALLMAMLAYGLPVIAGVSATTDATAWSAESGWPVIAEIIGGRWLGGLLAVAGLVSMWALFNSQLLYVSRIPFVVARDGWLPKSLASVNSTTAIPKASIIGLCGITTLLVGLSFGSLVVMLCMLYTAALTLEFLALVVLRVRKPHAHRPFRVPGGWWGIT
ncbi:MAG: APC family permease, partial [Proteobacteria bacterium]|nr:APC family permease [Pseudomonadota bacterium]